MQRTMTGAAALLVAMPLAASAETVRIAGFGGSDTVVVNGLVSDVLAEEIAAAGIEVEYTPVDGDFSQFILNALSAGTAPDLYYVDIFWSDSIAQNGLYDAADPASAEGFAPNLVAAFEREDGLIGLPKDFNTLALHYNVDIFDDAGVDYPAEGDTWDDFQTKLATVAEELGDVAGICVVPDYARFGPFALATGWQPFNAEGHTDLDADFRRAFEFYTGLVEAGAAVVAADIGEGWTGGCMSSEKTAVALEGGWMTGHLRDAAPSMLYGSTRMPTDPETGARGNLVFTVAWVVNPDSEVKDAAHELARILTSEKAQQWVLEQGLAIPSRSSLQDNPYLDGDSPEVLATRVVYDGLNDEEIEPYYFEGHGGAWMEPINSALNAVMLGEASVDDAIAEAQAGLDRVTGR